EPVAVSKRTGRESGRQPDLQQSLCFRLSRFLCHLALAQPGFKARHRRTKLVRMIVVVMVVMMMAVVKGAFPAVRAALRLEGAHHLPDVRAKTSHHIFEDMIGLNVDGIRRDFRWC